MRPLILLVAVSAALLLAASAGAQAPADRQLPLERVILSSAGLAHFEHEGEVDGDTVLTLPVRLDQVDDLLKSLVIFDSSGTVGGVTLAGKEPLEQAFRDLPFSREDFDSPAMLLTRLQGAEVVVNPGPANAQVSGRLVSVMPETVQLPNGQGTTERHRITVLTGQGLRTVILEELDSLQFLDDRVQGQLRQALDAIHANSARDRRSLTITLYGKGPRTVGYAYVVAAPVWKASYRIVLPAQSAPKVDPANSTALLQGWAVVENMTGNDWNDVQLTLVSGNPATFRQQLYTAYYVNRPELPVQVVGRVLPRPDTGAIGAVADLQQAFEARAEKAAEMDTASRARMARVAPSSPMAMPAGAPPPPPSPLSIAAPAAPAAAEQAATQVLFRLPDAVYLAAGQSLTAPFLARDLPIERLWVYQPDTNPRNPLAAVRVKNDGGSGLPPGILTLFERSSGGTSFVGDALLPLLPRGEDRLVSFALDTKTQIDREEKADRRTLAATIAGGVLRLNVTQRSETVYLIKAPADESRTVLIEQPRRPDWSLVSPDPKDPKTRSELTATHYRVRVPIEAGTTERVSVVLERPGIEIIELRRLSEADLRGRAESVGSLNPKVRAAFDTMASMRRDIAAAESSLRDLEKRREGISRDQSRIRENLKSVPQNSDLARRYLDTLGNQETALDQLSTEQRRLEESLRQAQTRLEEYIEKLQI